MIDELSSRFQHDLSITVAYLYCNFKRKIEQTFEHLLSNLLKQLCQARPSLPEAITTLYGACNNQQNLKRRPSLVELSSVLRVVAAAYKRVFVLVDALDECSGEDSCRTRLLAELFKLQAACGINLLVTTRAIPEITEGFSKDWMLEIRASKQDVQRYVEGHTNELPKFVRKDAALQEAISSGIVDAVDGMYVQN